MSSSNTASTPRLDADTAPGPRGRVIRERLASRTTVSASVLAEGRQLLAMEIAPTVDMPYPIYIASAEGSRMTDVDGNSYIDVTMGFGSHVLGHRPPAIMAALLKQMEAGWHYVVHNPLQVDLARLIAEIVPMAELTAFCNSGTEATMHAIRLARAFTGKLHIASFEGAYHGAHDTALVKADAKSARDRPRTRLVGKGIPAVIREQVLTLPFNDDHAFDLIRGNADTLAAVMVEPVQSSNPRLDHGEFLRELRATCNACDVLLIFDEVVTGFRLALGGGQEHFAVNADIATFGKALGGGLAIGAVAGRRDIMSQLTEAWLHDDSVFMGGTFSGNPLAMASGIAALETMRDSAATLYPHINALNDRLARRFDRFCQSHQIPAQMLNAGSIFSVIFQREAVHSAWDIRNDHTEAEREFYLHLLSDGIMVPGAHPLFLSAAHSTEDVDTVARAMENALLAVRDDGLL